MGDRITIRVRGLDEVQRALVKLPRDAQRLARAAAVDLSRSLARLARASGRASDRQSARAASTVRTATEGLNPAVVAGPHPLLFGSEFGARGRYGWYGRTRYEHSEPRQFRARRTSGYWFFPTQRRAGPEIARQQQEAMDAIVRAWSA